MKRSPVSAKTPYVSGREGRPSLTETVPCLRTHLQATRLPLESERGRLAQWKSISFTPRGSGVRNPHRPVYARSAVESGDCRAVLSRRNLARRRKLSRRRILFTLQRQCGELRLGKPIRNESHKPLADQRSDVTASSATPAQPER